MATMPPRSLTGQPAASSDWFASAAGRALLDSEVDSIREALRERHGQPWLWLGPREDEDFAPGGRGLHLVAGNGSWHGPVRCALPLPLANESVATVVVQHAAPAGRLGAPLFEECARVLLPGGRLWLFALNPLSPYRWHWKGSPLQATEPMLWRRRLRTAGLSPEPVSQGLGPRWRHETSPGLQQGPGVRAAYLLRAEKRAVPLTPVRVRTPLRLAEGVPAA